MKYFTNMFLAVKTFALTGCSAIVAKAGSIASPTQSKNLTGSKKKISQILEAITKKTPTYLLDGLYSLRLSSTL